MGHRSQEQQVGHTSHKKKSKKASKHAQSTAKHAPAAASQSSRVLELEEDEWCLLPTQGANSNGHSASRLDVRQNTSRPQGVDHELSYNNLALLNLMNRNNPINDRRMGHDGRPAQSSLHVHHQSASRCMSNGSADINEPWAIVSGASHSYDDSDLLAMGTWTQTKAYPDVRTSRSIHPP